MQAAMLICGSPATATTPHSSAVNCATCTAPRSMVHNDRITEHNASLLCIAKEI